MSIILTMPPSAHDSTEYTLSDCISCTVDERLNMSFELSMNYPINGTHFDKIVQNAWITCNANPYAVGEPFQIYSISKPISGVVTIKAEHKFYAAAKSVCRGRTDYSKGNTASALIGYLNQEITGNPVAGAASMFTDIPSTTEKDWSYDKPVQIRQIMADAVKLFGGMWEFVGDIATLKQRRGQNRGFKIEYGVNATMTTIERDASVKYSHVCPYWIGDVILSGNNPSEYMEKQNVFTQAKYVEVNANPDFFNPYMLDCSDLFLTKPTDNELESTAAEFIADYANKSILNGRELTVTAAFVPLKKTSEYINDNSYSANDDHVEIGDTVNVTTRYGESENMICTGTSYDVLKDRYRSIELSYFQPTVRRLRSARVQNTDYISSAAKSAAYTSADTQNRTQALEYAVEHPVERIPDSIVKVSDNEVYAIYGNTRETWKADGTGQERHNFRKILTAEVTP